ncbi:unnamed protein product (macronuclear) [Paramecium tetraurelia]|uniref:C3H1-type domain-containing protein n=1 Tax=Paramecium tetraurelia TaxID=5888 RepID=A0D6C0_PARTE|nr:uncharacterized protein GSPATT00001628001 [Paramecium tetraurelia]CAK78587.1 unnamed protein product [Paramecium tetraurelia]|eukprot:XP_001445984.1 hypothetical protein (macronuclear) [Paramecium tetraurelia strain d4-2]
MDLQYEEGEIFAQKSDKLEGVDSESSLRSLSDTNREERVHKTIKDELSSVSYVCPIFNFIGRCTQVECKKRHMFIQDGLDELITEYQTLLDVLVRNGEKVRVPYENVLKNESKTTRHQILKPKVISNYTQGFCEKNKRTLIQKLRKDIDKMQSKLKIINYLKKWTQHKFVDESDFTELYYSLNPTQQIHFMNIFRVLELQPPSFQ